MNDIYQRIGSFRISAVPTAGQNLLIQMGPMSDGKYVATNITFAAAPADITAAAIAVVNALNVLAPAGFNLAHLGDGVVQYVTYDQSPLFANVLGGTVARVQHTERYARVPDSVRTAVVAVSEVTKSDPAMLLASAGVGLALGMSMRGS